MLLIALPIPNLIVRLQAHQLIQHNHRPKPPISQNATRCHDHHRDIANTIRNHSALLNHHFLAIPASYSHPKGFRGHPTRQGLLRYCK